MTFGYETAEKYREEMHHLGERLGWRVDEVDEDCIMMKKDDKITERQNECVKQSWKYMSESEKIDCLKKKTDLIEKKLDDLIELFKEIVELKEADRKKDRSIQALQDKMSRLEHWQKREKLGFN